MSFINTFVKENIKAVIKWVKTFWFEAKLKARLTMIEWDSKRDYYWTLDENFEPVYKEYAPEEPGSEAAKLGGAMRLTSKFHVESTEIDSAINDDEYIESYRQSDL